MLGRFHYYSIIGKYAELYQGRISKISPSVNDRGLTDGEILLMIL